MKKTNEHSKSEDKLLNDVMESITSFANDNLSLPKGYVFEKWDKLSFSRIREWHLSCGIPSENLEYLTIPNPNGKTASIEPDGGIVVITKKDNGGNILQWIPVLSSEAKHQESSVGNAIERVFKNFNAVQNIFINENIFPYVCFGQGKGLGSSFQQNKIRIGMGNNVNGDVDIYDKVFVDNDGNKRYIKNGSFFIREKKWERNEIYNILIKALKQSYDYFVNNKKLNL